MNDIPDEGAPHNEFDWTKPTVALFVSTSEEMTEEIGLQFITKFREALAVTGQVFIVLRSDNGMGVDPFVDMPRTDWLMDQLTNNGYKEGKEFYMRLFPNITETLDLKYT